MKKCRVCHQFKDEINDFYLCSRKGGNPLARHTECKECAKTRIKSKHDPIRARRSHLWRKYKITLEEYDDMLAKQGTKCACCKTEEAAGKHNVFCVDHDHVTNAVRELLCKDCNIVLGIVKDSPEHLMKLIQYLAKHQ